MNCPLGKLPFMPTFFFQEQQNWQHNQTKLPDLILLSSSFPFLLTFIYHHPSFTESKAGILQGSRNHCSRDQSCKLSQTSRGNGSQPYPKANKHPNKLQAETVSDLIDFPFSVQTLMHYVLWQHLLKVATEAHEAFVLFASQNLAKNSYFQAFRIKNILMKIPLMTFFFLVGWLVNIHDRLKQQSW